jgi:microcystin-dependent protein
MASGTKRKSTNELALFPVQFPSGTVVPFAGATAPEGWVLCNGTTLSRSTYAALFAAIGTSWGNGDGSTTFNLPDLRGSFLRGKVDISTVSGSGTPSSNNATFTNHGINRTGFKVRLSSGTLTGLAVSIDYYAIVINSNTLAFATSKANALAGTKIAISGTNSAVIIQYEDPDASSRTVNGVGGNSGNNVGSVQDEAIKAHGHNISHNYNTRAGGGSQCLAPDGDGGGLLGTYTKSTANNTGIVTETRPQNSLVNYIIKL